MRKLFVPFIFIGTLGLANASQADQVAVNIAYPLDGSSYRISSGYPILPISFSVTCKDLEDHKVEWGYGQSGAGETLGNAKFRGTISLQFLQKFSKGTWVVWVSSDCGKNRVSFKVSE